VTGEREVYIMEFFINHDEKILIGIPCTEEEILYARCFWGVASGVQKLNTICEELDTRVPNSNSAARYRRLSPEEKAAVTRRYANGESFPMGFSGLSWEAQWRLSGRWESLTDIQQLAVRLLDIQDGYAESDEDINSVIESEFGDPCPF
jgi:hypothetical protein